MSWTAFDAKEVWKEDCFPVKRKKTGRNILIHFSPYDPVQIISKVKLDTGEILTSSEGGQVKVLYPEFLTETWTHKIYFVEILKIDREQTEGSDLQSQS